MISTYRKDFSLLKKMAQIRQILKEKNSTNHQIFIISSSR
jgi:hypothetical protein